MSRVAVLCSGQGAQGPDMFALTAEAPAAAEIFAAATEALGTDPRMLVREGAIHANKAGQILCCTQALAASAALGLARDGLVVAGYSVGELAAWGVAGLIAPRALLALAVERAACMDAATREPCGLGALGGLPRAAVDALCDGREAYVAIVNGPDRFIVGGTEAALADVLAEAEAKGAQRASRLPVEVASHTPLLAAAARAFGETLGRTSLPKRMPPGVRLLSGIDASQMVEIQAGAKKLAAQIGQTIDWAGCLDACVSFGVEAVLELGPGAALSRMMQDRAPDLRVRALSDFRTLEGARRWLGEDR